MTLVLKQVDHDNLCHGWEWEVDDIDILAQRVARVTLGQYRHVAQILEGLARAAPRGTTQHATDALKKLKVAKNGDPWHRDGWLFQVISWIAANQNNKGASRFDPSVDKMAQLEAHELLNAAGRAGRAGESSQGFVLIVPSRVVEFDDKSNLINAHWMTLQSIFSQSDQCLVIDDPTTVLLDTIHAGAFEQGMPAYFLSRLPASDENGTDAPIRNVISRSFAAFRARQTGDKDWVESRIAAAFTARKHSEPAGEEKWLDRVSGLTGVSVDLLREIMAIFSAPEIFETTKAAIKALMDWLKADPPKLLELVRPENVEGLFTGDYKKLQSDQERGEFALPVITDMLQKWMAGSPLNSIEASHPKEDAAKCEYSRHFVLRIVPDLAFVAGLPARLLTAQNGDDATTIPITLATLASCVREGCDSPENLAARLASGRSVSRVAARAHYEELLPYFQAGQIDENFEQTMDRYRKASTVTLFSKL